MCPADRFDIANAKALFWQKYPTAERYDVVSSSYTPNGRLGSLGYTAALVVYPTANKGNWTNLYRSNTCSTLDDALFEIMYWIGEDIHDVLETKPAEEGPHSGHGHKWNGRGTGANTKMRDADIEFVKKKPTKKQEEMRKRAGEPLQKVTPKRIRGDVEMSG